MGYSLLQGQKVLSNRVANYDMEVYLDTDYHKTRSETTLLWKNPSKDTIRELQFHLYYNAFKNDQSTFMIESNGDFVSQEMIDECNWGWSKITKISDEYGNDLSSKMEYINSENGTETDQTVLSVSLDQPVLPYDSIKIHYSWEAQIPKLMIRTGYNRDYYFMAQWFPKVGVYEGEGVRCSKKGKWNCHQYHRYTEYYSDFGNYRVRLNVPEDYIVGASGSCSNIEKKGNRKIHTYEVNDVIDFTWTAYPRFEEVNTKWKNVDIRVLHHEDRSCMAERYIESAKFCLDFLDQHVGKYPYPTLTIVDPPYHGIRSSGMEYPTLITGAGLYCLPQGIRTTETITVHELVHQYFMQMVATNEQEEAWLDEGFTSYYEARIIDQYYKYIMENDYFDLHISNKSWRRYRYVNAENPKVDVAAQPGWAFKHGGYSPLVYGKAAVTLSTLEGILGMEVMDKIMQTYFEKWKFKHPCGQDFVQVVSDVTQQYYGDRYGENMNWFFEETVFSSNICDYKLATVENRIVRSPMGYFDENEECLTTNRMSDQLYESEVILYRLGEIKLPVEVLLVFENGEEELYFWDGMERSTSIKVKKTHKVIGAVIDPEHKIDLDINHLNNSWFETPPKTGFMKLCNTWMLWIQQTMLSVSSLI